MVKKSARARSPVKIKKKSSTNKNYKSEKQLKQNKSFPTVGIGASAGGLKVFKTLAENAPDVIFRIDRDLRFIFVNKKISELTGIPKEQFYGKTLLDLGLPRDICIYLGKKAQEVFDQEMLNEFEFNFSAPDGLRWFHARIVPEFNIHGDVETALGIAHEITDLKRAESAYRGERAFRDSVMSSLRIGIAAFDLEGRQCYVNPSFCEMVGWSAEELEGAKPPFVYWPPEEMENITHAFQQVLSGKDSGEAIELRFQRRNGERFDALVLYSPLNDGQGNVTGWIRSVGDITEHKKRDKEIQELNRELEQRVIERTAESEAATKKLQEAEQKARLQLAELETIYDSAPVGLCVFDPQLNYVRINKRMAEINGVSAEDHIGCTPWEVIPELAGQAEGVLRQIIETGKPVMNVETSGETSAQPGVLRTWLEHWLPLKDDKGQVMGINVVAQEITERKRTEERILRQSAVLKGLNRVFRETLSGGTEEDLGLTCLSIAEKVTESKFSFIGEIGSDGLLHDIAISNPGWELCAMYDKGGHRRSPGNFKVHGLYGRVLKDGKSLIANQPSSHPDSIGVPEGHPLLTAFLGVPLIQNGKTIGIVAVGNREGGYRDEDRDALESMAPVIVESFERKRTEEKIKTLNEDLKRQTAELEMANKELESFTYSASHDLKSPLIVASGFCRRLSDRYSEKLDASGRRYLQRIRESCQHMNQLIEDLFNLSKATSGSMKFKSVDLSHLVKSLASQLKDAEPEREVDFIIEEGVTVRGDSGLLRIAVGNLLSNAWKFTSKSKQANIEFGFMKTTGEEPTYFVRDNGCGFDISMAEKLFKPFQRLHDHEEFSGTGIGLATVHRIMTRHGGRVWAEGAIGKGATFFFTLPC